MPDHAITDSYILTNEIGDAYFANDPRVSAIAFLLLTDDQQGWYYKKATKSIDTLNYQGFKLIDTQARQFPRKYQISPDEVFPWGIVNVLVDAYGYGYISTLPPQEVLDACCEEALALYDNFNTADPGNVDRGNLRSQGVTSFNIGGIYSETFGPNPIYQSYGLYSQEAFSLLENWIETAPFII
jgi:hypothetical protein